MLWSGFGLSKEELADINWPRWKIWPAWKFGHRQTYFDRVLEPEFNRLSIPLQSEEAFFYDVRELAEKANTLEEFQNSLKQRRDRRYEELRSLWKEIGLRIVCYRGASGFGYDLEKLSSKETQDQKFVRYLHLSRSFSYETLLGFTSLFMPPVDSKPAARNIQGKGGLAGSPNTGDNLKESLDSLQNPSKRKRGGSPAQEQQSSATAEDHTNTASDNSESRTKRRKMFSSEQDEPSVHASEYADFNVPDERPGLTSRSTTGTSNVKLANLAPLSTDEDVQTQQPWLSFEPARPANSGAQAHSRGRLKRAMSV